jgi:AcrR family transcriptional regulator
VTSATRTLLSRQERQAQLLRAAAVAFARTGFAATSMDDVAAEAGVTKLIVYRHFDSKEELYRAVLDAVNDRIREELFRALNRDDTSGRAIAAMLRVARDEPDGFRLLMTHAPREPQFAAEVADYRQRAIDAADGIVGERFADDALRGWGDRMILDYLVSSILRWLEVGTPERDEEFVDRATAGMAAMFQAWLEDPA